MAYTFDGPNRLIILSSGTTTLDVQDMYSRWKDWATTGDNLKYAPFFDVVGGNPTVGSNSISNYFFLLGGAKIRPQEANHTLTVDGILIDEAGGDPFTDTLGTFRVRIVQVVPLQAEAVATSGGTAGLTTEQAAMLSALAKIHGLIPGLPLVVTPSARSAGDVVQSITEVGGTVTIERS